MQKMRGVMVGVLAVGIAASAGAVETADLWPGATWYVDDDNYGKSGMDGTTPATAFGSLQEANDAAAVKAGDIVKVLPGTYDQGSSTYDKNTHPSRLVVTKKLRFEAEKGTVRVVGQLCQGSDPYGEGGVRCVLVVASAKGAEFHGMTFCDGASGASGNAAGMGIGEGGGVCVCGSQAPTGGKDAASFAGAFIVDCVVSNCWGLWSGGVRGGTSIRTLFIDCGGKSWGHSAGEAALWNCMIVASRALQADRPTVGNRSRLVNCTFYQCGSYGTAGDSTAFNCVYACRTGGSDMYASAIGVYPASSFVNCYGKTEDSHMLFAPALGDFRVLAGSAADGGGRTQYLTDEILLPADTEMKDFFGHPIDTTKETCCAGANQETAEAKTGYFKIPAGYTFNGRTALSETYAFAESFPETLVITPISDRHFRFRLGGFTGGNAMRYTQPDGTLHLCYPPMVTDWTSWAEDEVVHEYWTDPTADAATADGSEAHPFRTLQSAMDFLTSQKFQSTDYTIVHAKPGEYNEGGAIDANVSNRVVIPAVPQMILKSTGGAAVTTIRGFSDPNPQKDYFPGCGPAALRCVSFNSPSTSSRAIQGFTIADGRSGYVDYSSVDNAEYGAGILSINETKNIQVLDCVITNCWAVRCGAVMGTWNTRCAIYDCHGFGGVMRLTTLSGCYVDGSCSIGDGPAGGNANCVLGSETKSYLTTAVGASYTDNSDQTKWHVADLGLSQLSKDYHLWGTVAPLGTWSANPPDHGGTTAEIVAIDGEHGDWRQVTGSPSITAGRRPEEGTDEYGRWATNIATLVSSGLDGSKLSVTDGHILPGCYQKTVDGVFVTAANGGLALSGGKIGFNEATDAFALTISRGTSGTRPCLGVEINGTTNLFAVTPSVTVTAAEVAAAGGILSVAAVYGTDWYVNPDPAVGSDDNNGFTAETPKRTLAGVMSAGVVSGDTVHAARGAYDDGVMPRPGHLANCQTLSRVFVPAGVKLVSDEGLENTFIVGASSPAPDADIYGRGTNAVRCVYMEPGAVVRGFTLTGGRTWGYDWDLAGKREFQAGGVYSTHEGQANVLATLVENCVVSNCIGLLGGAGINVTFVNCRLFHCRAQRGSATENCGLYNVIVDEMDSEGGSGLCVNNCYALVNTTIGSRIRKDSGGAGGALWRQWEADYGITNTVCLGAANRITNAVNSVVAGADLTKFGIPYVTAQQCALDADYRPDRATSVLVDQGLNAAASATDVYGGQRIYNGTVDIGAVEADWRPAYAQDLANSGKFSVTESAPAVFETDEHAVSLPNGGTLTAVWTNPEAREVPYVVDVKLVGTGALTVKLNGAVLGVYETAGDVHVGFSNALAENVLTFAYAGEGSATIVRSKRALGTLLIVR